MWPDPHKTADLVTFTEEIHNEKNHFLYSVRCTVLIRDIFLFSLSILDVTHRLPMVYYIEFCEIASSLRLLQVYIMFAIYEIKQKSLKGGLLFFMFTIRRKGTFYFNALVNFSCINR